MRESDLLAYIYSRSAGQRASVLIGPGDDMAMVRTRGERLLIAVDQVVEGKHFARGTPWRAVGRKAVLRNLSDVAAMAAVPTECVCAVALSSTMTIEDARELYDGMADLAEEWHCPLVGGDISIHSDVHAPLVASLTILAEPSISGRVVQRQGAKAGDLLCVTGALGGSLQVDGTGKHLSASPRIREAHELVQALGDDLHAMIDISDGLGRDAGHLVRAAAAAAARGGGLDAEIDAARLPITPGCDWRRALSDGEDYELAFACAAGGAVPKSVAGTPVTVVGAFVPAKSPGGGVVRVNAEGQRWDASQMGWEHSSAPR